MNNLKKHQNTLKSALGCLDTIKNEPKNIIPNSPEKKQIKTAPEFKEIKLERQKLSYHSKMYKKSKDLYQKTINNVIEIEQIKEFLSQNKIRAIKLNNTVDPEQ